MPQLFGRARRMSIAFRFEHVYKRFRSVEALVDFTLQAEEGTVVGLLGENGAGKTTAIRILLGLLRPDAGRSEVLGLDSQRHSRTIRQRVGYVSERPALYEWMTVEQLGWFASGFYDVPYLPRFRELIRQFDVPLGKRIRELSRGQRARVVLALALAHEPPLLVLDEPTAGLDAMARRDFLESVVEVAAAGRTVLLSSHLIDDVERVADVVAILRSGRLVLVERVEELKRSVREVTVTLRDGQSEVPLPGKIIQAVRQDRQWRTLLRDVNDEQLRRWQSEVSVADVSVRVPSLEEVFLAYMETKETADVAEKSDGE
ncbi:MAG: ABC transporter ATP-binding protein [Planctomycetota bacterium]|nr:MAG: ABC transporter ATP-binding protein [Planctomycetota bacterium]